MFLLQVIKHNIATLPDLENGKKIDKIRHRAVIRYLGFKGLTPKQVHQDMEVTLGEDATSYSMVKKLAGEFKRGWESLKNDPHPGRPHNAQFCPFCPFSLNQGLEG